MWGLITSTASRIFKALTGQAKQAPKPAPKKQNPVSSFLNGVTSFFNNPAKTVSQQSWLPKQVTNWAAIAAKRQAEQRRIEAQRQRRLAEEARRKKQAQVDAAKRRSQQMINKWVSDAGNFINSKKNKGGWGNFFDKSGNYKGTGLGDWFRDPLGSAVKFGQKYVDPDVKKARQQWQKWYKSDDEGAVQQRATDKYEKVRREYEQRTRKIVDQIKNEKVGFWGGLTGQRGRNEQRAREFAQKEFEKMNANVGRYEAKLKSYETERAKKMSWLKKRQSAGTLTQKDVNSFNKWVTDKVDDLEYMRASHEGIVSAFDTASKAKMQTASGKLFEWTGQRMNDVKNVAGGIWRYTLGEGDENVPSLVTVPSRVINSVGNWINPNRGINKYGQATQQGLQGKNPWQASWNQRNFNIPEGRENYSVDTDINTSYNDAVRLYKKQQKPSEFSKWYKGNIPTKEQWLNEELYDNSTGRKVWAGGTTRRQRYFQGQGLEGRKVQSDVAADTMEFLADPLFAASWIGKGARGAAAIKAANAANKIKTAAKASPTISKIADSKLWKWTGKTKDWLNAEAKTRHQVRIDKLDAVRKAQKSAQDKIIPQLRRNQESWFRNTGKKLDDSVLDRLDDLSDADLRILTRMQNGKLSPRDAIKLMDIRGSQFMKPTRDKLKSFADDWATWNEKQAAADKVIRSRFKREGKFYSPRTRFLDDLSKYNPRMFKKNLSAQTADDFRLGARERRIVSNIDEEFAKSQGLKTGRITKQKAALQKEYRDMVTPATKDFKEFDKKYGNVSRYVRQRMAGQAPTTGLGRSILNSAADTARLPSSLWKKSVLKYRPAWTVNNVAYNVQAAALAGGPRALAEHLRLLSPKAYREALKHIPDNVRAEVANELGKGRLTKFYSRVENTSRVAAYNAAKAKGLTDEQALKRVNNYLFDYKTKNWERPFKATMPFWGWTKNVSKAAARMPGDRPLAAKAYNLADREQQQQFDRDFETMRGELKKMGYSDAEIDTMKQEQKKYYEGKLKVGDRYVNTPFNVFSSRGAGEGLVSFNPFLQAGVENATAKDSFGRELKGSEASLWRRMVNKFPQAELGRRGIAAMRQNAGLDKPTQKWISQPGSGGYGMTKEKQGYDSTKTNYDRNMDANKGLKDDALAFLGKPKDTAFDKDLYKTRKKMEMVKKEYFGLKSDLEYEDRQKQEQAIFKKHGITSKEFYEGELAKYDTATTKGIKKQKADARVLNQKLYDEYAKQPHGTRTVWAVNKLRALVKSGYFDDNPYKRGFDWLTVATVESADKTMAYRKAKESGNWTEYHAKYGNKFAGRQSYRKGMYSGRRGISQKALVVRKAIETGDWSEWRRLYGSTATSEKARIVQRALKTGDWTEYRRRYGSKFKSASPEKVAEAKFLQRYTDATKSERRKLLEDNPKYNRRKDWTDEQWDKWREDRKQKEQRSLRNWGSFVKKESTFVTKNASQAAVVRAKSRRGRSKARLVWK